MYDFEHLYEPSSVTEALQMMMDYPAAKILAGGSDLLIQLRDGVIAGCDLISIYMLDELRGISMDDEGTISIGALTSFTEITRHPIIQQYVPVLGKAVDTVGGPQIRNIGSIGGNICNGHTGADSASTLWALDALVELKSLEGTRIVPICDFYKPEGGVALRPAELLTKVLITKENYEGCQGAYYKYAAREAMDVDILGCSVNMKISEKAILEDLRICFGVAGPNPVRALAAEAYAKGRCLNDEEIDHIAKLAVSEISPRSDFRASKAFRTHIAKEICIRLIRQCKTESEVRQHAE